MDEDELVHELVNSLAFEVEAIPKDNVIKFTSTNGTPLNVKVRVRNKDEPRLVQRGIVSVPKLGKHIASVDKIRLISSDQTILSFNVYMETELEKQCPPKNRKHGFKFFKLGGCLGTSYGEDEGPYLPGPSSNKALRSRTSSKSDSDILNENVEVAQKLKTRVETSNRNQKKLFGKCKPGGCLDPPFGEDKEPYRPPSVQAHIKPKQTVSKVEDSNKAGQSISKSTVEQGISSKTSDKILRKEPNKETTETKALLDIYARSVSLEHSTTSNYSNATLRNSSRMSSSKILDAGINISKTYNNDSLRQSYQYPETYFIPPKDILQHKEEERKYSRERSNDQIRPTTTRQESERQTSYDSHIFDVPNKNKKYPENVDIRSPQTTKLSKQKVKDNKEKIKQTLTDLTSNEIDKPPKLSVDYRKNNDISLNMPLVTQKLKISSDDKETPPPSVSYFKHVDEFEIPILPEDLDLSIISKRDSMDAKNIEQHQNLISTENKEVKIISSNKLNKPENEYPSTDMTNQNIPKNKEEMKSETTNTAKPELGNIEDLHISPTLVSAQDEVKILRSVPSTDTQKIPQDYYFPSDLNIALENKPAKTSDLSNLSKDQTKLSKALRSQSLEKVLDTDDTKKKNITTPKSQLKYIVKNEYPSTDIRNQNILQNNEPMKSETINTSKPELGNIEDLYISSILVSAQDEVKILRSVPSTDTQKIPQVDYLPFDLNTALEDKPAKTSDSSNLLNDQTKLSMVTRLQSLEKVLDTVGTNKKTTPETHLKDNIENDIRDKNDYLNTENYVETIKNLPGQEIAQEQKNESHGPKNKMHVNENPIISFSGVNDGKINKSLRTAEIPKKQLKQNKNIVQEQIPDAQTSDNIKINEMQKSLKDFMDNQDIEKNKSQVLDLNRIHNEKLNDLPDIETHNRTLEENLGSRNSRDTPNISIPKKQLKPNKNVLQEQIPGSQTSDKFKINEIQKSLNDITDNQGSEKNKSQVLDLNFIHNENLNDLLDVETYKRTLEENLGNRNSRDTPNISEEVKNELQSITNLITNQSNSQNNAPYEIFYKEVSDEQLRKAMQNDSKEIIAKSMAETSIAQTFINDSKSNNHVVITPEFGIVKTQEPGDTTKIASDLKEIDKQDSKYAKSNLNGNQANNNIENTFVSDHKKRTLIDNIVNNSRIKQQPIDTNIKKHQTYSLQNSSNDSIVNAVQEFATTSTNNMDSSSNLKTNNFNFEENKKAPENVNLTDNDNVKIKNTLLPDRNEIHSLNTQDRIPSAILQKTQLIRTDSDFCNDDINVIKPFKRNTFTIVASNTSLEKQEEPEEPISTQDTNNVLVTDEHFNAKVDGTKSPSIETNTDRERFAQINFQNNNGIDTQKTKTTDSILNSDQRDNTSLMMTKYDQSKKTYNERENKSDFFELLDSQKTSNTEVTSSARYEEPVRTNNYAKLSLTSDITSNTINIVDTEILRNPHQPDTIMNNKEKLILKNVSSDMAKQLSELLENSDNGSENVSLEPKLEITPQNKEISGNDVPNDKLNDITMDNKTIQIIHSKLRENTDNISNNKISTSNIPKNSKGADSMLATEFTEYTSNVTHGETVSITSNDNSDTNSTRNSKEYRSELLKISESKLHEDEIGKPKNSPVNFLQSSEIGEPDENKFKLFSQAKSEKIEDSELNVQPTHTKDQNDIMTGEDDDITKKSDLGRVGSLTKVTDKIMLEEGIRYYVENETGAGSLEKIEKKSLDTKDDFEYYNEYDHDTKMYEDSDLKNTSESATFGDKAIDQIPIISIDSTGNYSEYDGLTKVNENVYLRNISKQASEGNFIAVIDEKPLLVENDVAHDVKHDNVTRVHEDGTLKKVSEADAMGTYGTIIDVKPLAPKQDTRYYGEYAPLSKTPISINNLSNIDQSGLKEHLDPKKLQQQSDSIILKQQLGVKEKVLNQNGNKLNETDHKGMILSPVHKTKSEVLFLNLALQSYMNDNNETVVQTISPMVEPLRYTDDNITVVQSLIRHGHEIRIPVDVENDLSLKFMSKTHEMPQGVNIDQNSSKIARITRNLSEHAHHHPEDVNKSLAFIYERELIPLHNIIKNLTEEINTLTAQQEVLKDKQRGAKRTKSLRLIPVNKRCGCGRT